MNLLLHDTTFSQENTLQYSAQNFYPHLPDITEFLQLQFLLAFYKLTAVRWVVAQSDSEARLLEKNNCFQNAHHNDWKVITLCSEKYL